MHEATAAAIEKAKKLLIDASWLMYYECYGKCGKWHYDHEDHAYEVLIKKDMDVVWIRLDKHIIAGPFQCYQLPEKIKQFIT